MLPIIKDMPRSRLAIFRNRPSFPVLSTAEKVMLGYAFVMALYYLGDTTIGYIVPVIMTEHLQSPALMGIVFAASSAIGLVIDLLLPQFLPNKDFRFFAPATFVVALFFPLLFLTLPSSIWSFLLAMAVWGLYYELARFSHFSFIHQTLKPAQHDMGWGVLQAFQSLILLVAPILSISLLNYHENFPFGASIAFFLIGLAGYVLLRKSFNQKKTEVLAENQPKHPTNRFHEIRVWLVFMKKIWPLYLFLLGLTLLDSSFWTMGALLSEELRDQSFLGNFVITAYIFPSVFMALIARQIARPWGKKKTAFVTAAIGTLILALGGLFVSGSSFVLVILAASFFLSISFPEMYAVFEDFVARLNHNGNDMVGLEGSATSLGYVIGPILAGFLSTYIGYQKTLMSFAFIFFVTAIVAFLKVPSKVRLPQKELETID